MSRGAAEGKLTVHNLTRVNARNNTEHMQGTPEGTYVVRDSSSNPGDYVLSTRSVITLAGSPAH